VSTLEQAVAGKSVGDVMEEIYAKKKIHLRRKKQFAVAEVDADLLGWIAAG